VTGGAGPHEPVFGQTLASGPPTGATSADAPYPAPGVAAPAPSSSGSYESTAPSAPAEKKGRSKAVLLMVGVIGIAGVAYGAGLLLNQADVPKGTTVLGVDIGGTTKEEATEKLEVTLGDRAAAPVQLSVKGKTIALDPEKAGLSLDTETTVQQAAGSDYNPVTVIGALFGQARIAQPAMDTDDEKLRATLEELTGGSGSVTEGTIKFEPGRAVAVYGKAGKAVDVDKAVTLVKEAYRTMVESGESAPVEVPVTTKEPTIGKAEVDRMMKEFAKPAMSGLVTIQTDAAHRIPFGPDLSLPKILGVKAVGGELQETYDLKVLKKLYGGTFDGVQITTASGKRGVLPQDVAAALRTALRGKTTAERTGTIDTTPN
jgi:hypothetical protein